jgi:hypothetical protein
VLGLSTATAEVEDGAATVSAGAVFDSIGEAGFEPSLFLSTVFGGGDAGAKSSSNPRSLSESDSSSFSSTEIGGNSECELEKPSGASTADSGPFALAFLKLANADSKSSLALAWSIAANGSGVFAAEGAADASSPAGGPKKEPVPLLVGLLSLVGDATSFLTASDPEPDVVGLGPVRVISAGDANVDG